MKTLFLLFVIGAVYVESFSQGYIPPSADAHSFLRQANTPVNYYTGTTGISVPLGQVSGKELTVPVSLSYDASGIKVNEIASSVGLGWTLSAGGIISRIVRGLPDDLANGFCKPSPTDTEPDLYFFALPGRLGKFVLDQSGNPTTIPFQNIVIKPGICATSTNIWEITDENGVNYRFGVTANERETTTSVDASGVSTSFTSSWFLSEINSPNRTEKISFYYLTSGYNFKNYFFTKYDFCQTDLSVKDQSSTITVSTRYISSIVAPLGTINFSWNFNRQDVSGGLSLSSLQIISQGQQIAKQRFQYSYFQSAGCSTQLCYRLRLDKIFDLAPDPQYSFYYNTDVNLPSRDAKNFDHWGYYNNNTVDSWIPQIFQPDGVTVFLSGSSREPSAVNTLANTLTQIVRREGMTQNFQYESHSAVVNNNNVTVGGARIKNIVTTDGQGNTYSRSFSYQSASNSNLSSGILFRTPYYMVTATNSQNAIVVAQRLSHPYNELLDVNGTHVGYTTVTETISGNGKTIYTYTNFDTHPDVDNNGVPSQYDPPFSSVSDRGWERGNPVSIVAYNSSGNPMHEELFTYNFTLTNKKIVHAQKSGSILWNCPAQGTGSTGRTGTYDVISRPFVLVNRTVNTYDPGSPGKKASQVTAFGYDPGTYQLTSTSVYDANIPAKKYINNVKYVTHPDYFTDCNSTYNSCMTSCAGISDPYGKTQCQTQCQNALNACPGPAMKAIVNLVARNQINAPVETYQVYQNGSTSSILSSAVNLYQPDGASGTFVTLNGVWQFDQQVNQNSFSTSRVNSNGSFSFDSRMRRVRYFNTYDQQNGNLLLKTDLNGLQTGYLWGYGNNLITNVATNPSGGNRQLSYTYMPLVGKTSSTDVNGLTNTNGYDIYNRLSLVKDSQGNIRKRYRYHYKNETPGFLLSSSNSQAVVNDMVTFQLTDVAVSAGGPLIFQWDFGDGTIIQNGSTYVTHAYSSAGNFTVKVTGTNQEYGAVARTLSIGVLNPLSVSICANGPTRIDYCNVNPTGYGNCTTAQNQNPNASLILTATANNGCNSQYNYNWAYQNTTTGSGWLTFGTNSPTSTFNYSTIGDYQVRCTVTDACGHSQVQMYSSSISFYKSSPNCTRIQN